MNVHILLWLRGSKSMKLITNGGSKHTKKRKKCLKVTVLKKVNFCSVVVVRET